MISETWISESDEWPICFWRISNKVDIPWSHSFWGHWLIRTWEDKNNRIRCPMCRRQINLMFSEFTWTDSNKFLYDQIKIYNNNFNGLRSFRDKLIELPFLMMKWVLSLQNIFRVIKNIHLLFIMVISMIYLIMPLDIFPEALFGVFGLIDDLIVICSVSLLISNLYLWEYLARQ